MEICTLYIKISIRQGDGKAAKPNNFSSDPGAHEIKGENQLPQAVLCSVYTPCRTAPLNKQQTDKQMGKKGGHVTHELFLFRSFSLEVQSAKLKAVSCAEDPGGEKSCAFV